MNIDELIRHLPNERNANLKGLPLPVCLEDMLSVVLPILRNAALSIRKAHPWCDMDELTEAGWHWLVQWMTTPDALARMQAHPAPEAYLMLRLKGAMLDHRNRESRYRDLETTTEDVTHYRRPKHRGSDIVAHRSYRKAWDRDLLVWDDPADWEIDDARDAIAKDHLDREILAALVDDGIVSRVAERVQRRPATVAARIRGMLSRYFLTR